MKTNMESLKALFADLVEQNEERRHSIKSQEADLINIDLSLKEKEDQLIPLIGEEATRIALKALKSEKIKELNDQPLPEGSHKDLIEMRAELTSLIGLVDEEIGRSTPVKKGSVRGTRIPGRKGSGAWFKNDQITTEPHENGRDTRVLCPFCNEWYANENSAYRHIETKHPGGIEKILSGENLYL
jgi:hypothetical protein